MIFLHFLTVSRTLMVYYIKLEDVIYQTKIFSSNQQPESRSYKLEWIIYH